MKRVFLAGLVAAVSLNAQEFKPDFKWTTADTMYESLFILTLAADCLQTHQISADPTFHEDNAFLGLHPSRKKVNTYFAAVALAHVGISMAFPHNKGRRAWQVSTIAFEGFIVGRNARLGVRIKF